MTLPLKDAVTELVIKLPEVLILKIDDPLICALMKYCDPEPTNVVVRLIKRSVLDVPPDWLYAVKIANPYELAVVFVLMKLELIPPTIIL